MPFIGYIWIKTFIRVTNSHCIFCHKLKWHPIRFHQLFLVRWIVIKEKSSYNWRILWAVVRHCFKWCHFSFKWLYSPSRTLASFNLCLHSPLSPATLLHKRTPSISFAPFVNSSFQRFLGHPTGLLPCSKQSIKRGSP